MPCFVSSIGLRCPTSRPKAVPTTTGSSSGGLTLVNGPNSLCGSFIDPRHARCRVPASRRFMKSCATFRPNAIFFSPARRGDGGSDLGQRRNAGWLEAVESEDVERDR